MLEEQIEKIIAGIDPTWNKLEIMRYVYIEVGKNFQVNTDFYLTARNKLQELKLTDEEMRKIYFDDYLFDDNKVICKSSAALLKKIYDRLGINSRMVKTVEASYALKASFPIYHYFLVASDDYNNYFLTPNADIHNIQNGLSTEHFASDIPYVREHKDGKNIKSYDADEEIEHKTLSKEELYEIDKKIGYLTNFEGELIYIDNIFDMIYKKASGNVWYLSELRSETPFYQKHVTNNEGNINFLDKDIIDKFMMPICYDIEMQLLNTKTISSSFDEWYNIVSVNKNLNDNIKYIKMLKNLVDSIRGVQAKKEEGKDDIKKDVKSLINKFISKMQYLSDLYIDKDLFPPYGDELATNKYICKKFELMFEKLFHANSGYKTDYNEESYAEQIKIIKEKILPKVFRDLSKKNCQLSIKQYDEKVSPILNRIYIAALKNKETGEYSTAYNIMSDEESVYYEYNLKENVLKRLDIDDIVKISLSNEIASFSDFFGLSVKEEEEEKKIKK